MHAILKTETYKEIIQIDHNIFYIMEITNQLINYLIVIVQLVIQTMVNSLQDHELTHGKHHAKPSFQDQPTCEYL